LIHVATVDTARLPPSLLDEVAEERGAWRKRCMVDVAVQRLVHSEHELGHTTSFPHAAPLLTTRKARLFRRRAAAAWYNQGVSPPVPQRDPPARSVASTLAREHARARALRPRVRRNLLRINQPIKRQDGAMRATVLLVQATLRICTRI